MSATRALALAAAVWVLSGCASHPNPRLTAYDEKVGYRYANVRPDEAEESLFVILAFSGGGTRAAAFSYGVLEGLRSVGYQRPDGTRRTLLEDVDVISSVSGGSFTAAHYAIFGAEGFESFERNFLYRDIQGELILRALAPWNWARLARSDFSRIDLATELYDEVVFGGATFRTLLGERRRPYLLLNATDMTQGSRFEFTQDQFDLLCSDLSEVKVARAVAASSAFPVLLSPLTLRNYSAEPCQGYVAPAWLTNALKPENPPRRLQLAQTLASYRENAQDRPFVHLLDGGLADNIGLRGPYIALSGQDSAWSLYTKINRRTVHRVLVITANAKTGRDPGWDKEESPPGVSGVLGVVTTGPMGNYSFETVQLVADHFQGLTNQLAGWHACETDGRAQCKTFTMRTAPPPDVDFHAVELAFDKLTAEADRDLRACLEGLATSFRLPAAQVTLLRQVARRLLASSPEFIAAMKRIAPAWRPPEVPIDPALLAEACPKR
ncbi:MAG TPA: patatin-like phospholipase family protein [Methylomirabilota bacterium]|nr:patatin-like phospholipase family protein [Methylomirabilota bacterium]